MILNELYSRISYQIVFSGQASLNGLLGRLARRQASWTFIGQILSRREAEIPSLLGNRFGGNEIAEQLFVAPSTVEKHPFHVRLIASRGRSKSRLRRSVTSVQSSGSLEGSHELSPVADSDRGALHRDSVVIQVNHLPDDATCCYDLIALLEL